MHWLYRSLSFKFLFYNEQKGNSQSCPEIVNPAGQFGAPVWVLWRAVSSCLCRSLWRHLPAQPLKEAVLYHLKSALSCPWMVLPGRVYEGHKSKGFCCQVPAANLGSLSFPAGVQGSVFCLCPSFVPFLWRGGSNTAVGRESHVLRVTYSTGASSSTVAGGAVCLWAGGAGSLLVGGGWWTMNPQLCHELSVLPG